MRAQILAVAAVAHIRIVSRSVNTAIVENLGGGWTYHLLIYMFIFAGAIEW